ncbi:hypothetical protein QTH87_15930 [Variovorax sp. J22P168]|nr:hypothetical protein [Variovorax sp. J22P168]MDM0013924.1 hypothetical protein [Variovorax sp. J22P168]
MEASSLLGTFGSSWMDDAMLWAIASAAAVLALYALVNALDLFLETDAG